MTTFTHTTELDRKTYTPMITFSFSMSIEGFMDLPKLVSDEEYDKIMTAEVMPAFLSYVKDLNNKLIS